MDAQDAWDQLPESDKDNLSEIFSRVNARQLPAERNFLMLVKAMKGVGYGRMMQIISRQWYRELQDPRLGGTGSGAFTVGDCVEALPAKEQAMYVKELQSDPLFSEGEVQG